jgi:FkbM family methyltransferase
VKRVVKLWSRILRGARKTAFHLTVRVHPRDDLVRLGSDYGGWTVPQSLVGPDDVCFCAGVGEDITFDLALIETFGCEVIALDPTPRAIAYVGRQEGLGPRFHFLPVGVWSSKEALRFYEPRDPSHVSHSVVNLQGTSGYFTADCDTVPALMRQLGHERLAVLKLDVEGAEHAALQPVLAESVDVTTICVEFDQPAALRDVLRTCRTLSRAGYELVARRDWDCTFVRRDP